MTDYSWDSLYMYINSIVLVQYNYSIQYYYYYFIIYSNYSSWLLAVLSWFFQLFFCPGSILYDEYIWVWCAVLIVYFDQIWFLCIFCHHITPVHRIVFVSLYQHITVCRSWWQSTDTGSCYSHSLLMSLHNILYFDMVVLVLSTVQ